MYHYTYLITFENNMKYIGVRSCKCSIEKDSYLGSSKIIPSKLYETCKKEILQEFSTRAEAVENEAYLHKLYDVAKSKDYYNQVCQTSTKFDQQGCYKETHAHIKAISDKLSGRSAKDYQYIAIRANANKALRGCNRTAKQLANDKANSIRQKGSKNPKKGHSSIEHPKYKPWYYITPDGVYTEVYDTILNFCNTNTWFGYKSICNAIHNKAHMHILRGKYKGYTFGILASKPEYITQENILIYQQLAQHLQNPSLRSSEVVFSEKQNTASLNTISKVNNKRKLCNE